MSERNNWNPRSSEVLSNPTVAYDEMRRRCPVAHSDHLGYSVFRHADVMRILQDHNNFSSQVSRNISVPNSMDPPQHTAYRRCIEPYFSPERMAQFEPVCQSISQALIANLPKDGLVEIMSEVAHPFALQMQCSFLGWPQTMHQWLMQWVKRKNEAALAGDKKANAEVSREFEETILALLDERRQAESQISDDVTARLMRERIDGQPLTDEAIVSILRNWTVGELQTMAASVGIIAHYLACHPDLQIYLRTNPQHISAATDEILRIQAPLQAATRTPTRPVQLGNYNVKPGERITISWLSANRDESVFGDPDEFRLDRDPSLNLLYGSGIHVCPGAPLARLELTSIIETLLKATQSIKKNTQRPAVTAIYPDSGYREMHLRLQYA